ncbi:hypothetical protein N7457_005464 [Penicillium paradoxum]|uniref:uncharacterized protein n=1 Tax=Penicillium paradoxum TaxID=176176 RepID=UPI0025473A4C|nr:uncharacterized protein N7457_005464 [Penicillium paradoxum]KAJ5780304.1 hypothetical protein N7457_005464 [Penicillium paradoxum]
MDGNRVELPDGHLVNLSPRPARPSPYKAYRAEYQVSATELSAPVSAQSPQAISADHVIASVASGNVSQTSKATKLPLPKNLVDNHNDELNQTPCPTGLPKPKTPSQSGRPGSQPRSSEKGRDQYWRKIRDKFEKDSPLSPRSPKSKENGKSQSPNPRISYHRCRPPISSPQLQKSPRGAILRSGIPTPTGISRPAQDVRIDASVSRPVDSLNKWQKQGDQWVNLDATETTPRKSVRTDTTVDSSPQSHSSISPVSAEESSITDWEDRFVVNMPTAKDPNPPMMTAQQISDYQKSIERVHREGGQMLDPDSLPSRNPSPESKCSLSGQRDQSHKEVITSDGAFDGDQIPNLSPDEYRLPLPHSQSPYKPPQAPPPASQPTTAPQRVVANHYYSPDEIGHNRISTIWEESPTKIKEKRHPQNADGSFLGCREISGEKNPDDILKFASPDDASLHPRPLALASKNKQKETKEVKKGITRKTTHKVEETLVLQDEKPQTFRNTKPAQCSKQSTISQEQICVPNPTSIPESGTQDSGKENFHPTSNSPDQSGDHGKGRGEDDLFITTPTITPTMIPTPDKKLSVPKLQGLRRPGGASHTTTAEAIKAVRARAQMITTPLGLRPGGSSSNIKPTIPILKSPQILPSTSKSTTEQDQAVDQSQVPDQLQDHNIPARAAGTTAHTVRGFIRTSGLAKPSGLVKSPTDSLTTILRNGTECLRHRAETLRNASGSLPRSNRKQSKSPKPTLPSRDNSESSRSERSFQSAKESQAITGNVPVSPPKVVKAETKHTETKHTETKHTETKHTETEHKKTKPVEKKSSANELPSSGSNVPRKPVPIRITISETPPSSHNPDKLPTSTRKISAQAKPSKLDKPIKATKTATSAQPAPDKTKNPDAGSKADQRAKILPLPRLRTTDKVLEIAELDGLQVASPKDELFQPNITDVFADLGDMHHRNKDHDEGQGISPLILSLVFNILVIAVTQVNRIFRMGADSPYFKFVVNNTLNMTGHCWRVFECIFTAVSHYQATGAWPRPRGDKAIRQFMVELLQAVLYLLVLGFAAMLIGRTASYVVLVSRWILWFARPFVWVFQCIGRALIV